MATGATVAICFGGPKQNCLVVGTSDNIICVYSIPNEDVLIYAFVYDQPTKLIYSNGVIYSGMKNGQFAKLKLSLKEKMSDKSSSLGKMNETKKSFSSLVSAEDLFGGFGFNGENNNSEVRVKPKGLESVLKPSNKLSSTIENAKSAKFHKMSAAIISPDEIASMARQEAERKKKLEAKMSLGIVLNKVLPAHKELPSPRPKEKRRKSLIPEQSGTSKQEAAGSSPGKEQNRRSFSRAVSTNTLVKEIIKENKTAKRNTSGRYKKPSRSNRTPKASDEVKNMMKSYEKFESEHVKTSKSEDNDVTAKVSTSSLTVPLVSRRKISGTRMQKTSLPEISLRGVSGASRKISKPAFRSEQSELLKSVLDQYEKTLVQVRSEKFFQPTLPNRKISSHAFSFSSRPSSRVQYEKHSDCYPKHFDEEPIENPNYVPPDVREIRRKKNRAKTAVASAIKTDGNGLILRRLNTFELNTYYPSVLPRTQVTAGPKIWSENSKYCCPIAKVQVAPTNDFFDTELTIVKNCK